MRIVYFPSHNSFADGSFLSMVSMVRILRDDYNIDPFVVLTNKGYGQKLLDENHIPYQVVQYYPWVMPINKTVRSISRSFKRYFLNPIALCKIKKLFEEIKPDLVHINTSLVHIGAVAAYSKKIPVVWHIREYLEEDLSLSFSNKKYSYQMLNKANKVIAISEGLKAKYNKLLTGNNIVVVYNGVDIEKYYNPEKNIFTNNKNNTFIITGRLHPKKGHKELLDALKIVYDKGYHNFTLHIVGRGRREELNLKNQTKELGLEENIVFDGFHLNTEDYYKKADVMFMTSKCEAFGRVTVEAMMGGLLVIGSDTGANPEIIGEQYGYLYHQGNSEDLADKIIYVLEHIDEARTKMQAGRQRALELFSSDKNAAEIYKLYTEILDSEC